VTKTNSKGGTTKLMDDKITLTLGKQKRIALIAHDNKKKDLWE
jgi:hypothetical protein